MAAMQQKAQYWSSARGTDDVKRVASRVVVLADGAVRGTKYWNGDYFEFYGIPYATVPKGRDRFQAPLPPEPWQGVFEASKKQTLCKQCYMGGDDDYLVDGEEECLFINLLVPELASETNLLPVIVYIHSGAFSGGSGNMANGNYLARHDVIVINFNYRLGALGFACLGNKEIPGNAALKDQVAALRWINKNIKKFGGDPNRVTLAGFSVGATMAELLSLSKATTGLFNKLILESGSALAPFAINRDPISTAKNIAISLGYNGTISLEGLTEFYLNASVDSLAEKSVNYHLQNSTFGFAPCIENIHEDIEPILTESPLDILKKGQNNHVSVLTGFADMEGLSRSIKFGVWREEMNEDFSKFLPADLKFDNDKARDEFISEVKKHYFNNKPVNAEALQKYIDYFSDSMFKYNILDSAKLHTSQRKKPVYLYEFTYTGKLNVEHNYMDRIKGASHRDQTAYILDFHAQSSSYKDLDTRDRLTTMWTDFVKYGNPTAFESALINVKWLPYKNSNKQYLEIGKKLTMKKDLFEDGYNFWYQVYERYYWTPTAPKFIEIEEKIIPLAKEVPQKKKTAKKEKPVKEEESSITNITPKEKSNTEEKESLKEKGILKEENTNTEKKQQKEDSRISLTKENNTEKEALKEKIPPKERKTLKTEDNTEANKVKKNDVLKENKPTEAEESVKTKETPIPKENTKESPKEDIPKAKPIPKSKVTPNEKQTVKETNKE
ncbi:esterase E4-like [Bicyclus anynana]|uniref:Esterase E4-like n=1 Tax=Bicyclus anynana TaxID=110368 RepID=A0ABM3LYK8_BICAN|nr:esterase E4-like [Bicyclus anynana]